MSAVAVEKRVDDTGTGVLHVAQPEVLLEGGWPAALDSIAHVIIHADTVRLSGTCRLPGRTIEIVARRIDADNAMIDVSGSPVKGYDPDRIEPSLNGTAGETGPKAAGRNGAAGEDGRDGGRIEIVAGELVGKLSLLANGSAGGSSQRGGDGAAGLEGKDGADGEFIKLAGWFQPEPVCKYGGESGTYELTYFWQLAKGELGTIGHPGGIGGAPGKPGNGGAGGMARLTHIAKLSTLPVLEANRGDAGVMGKPGTAAAAVKITAQGGRNRLHLEAVNCPTYDGFSDDSEDLRYWFGYLKFPVRAGVTGVVTEGETGATIMPPPAVHGRLGLRSVTQKVPSELHFELGLDYLNFVLRIADEAAQSGNSPRALERYQWLEQLTPTTSERSDSRFDLHQKAVAGRESAQRQIEALARGRAARAIGAASS